MLPNAFTVIDLSSHVTSKQNFARTRWRSIQNIYNFVMDKDKFTLQTIRQDLIDNNLQAKAIIQVSCLIVSCRLTKSFSSFFLGYTKQSVFDWRTGGAERSGTRQVVSNTQEHRTIRWLGTRLGWSGTGHRSGHASRTILEDTTGIPQGERFDHVRDRKGESRWTNGHNRRKLSQATWYTWCATQSRQSGVAGERRNRENVGHIATSVGDNAKERSHAGDPGRLIAKCGSHQRWAAEHRRQHYSVR